MLKPDLSVVLPLADEHGYGERCLAGWLAQTHPRARLQLVVVDAGDDPALTAKMRPLLAPHDLWLEVCSSNEAVLYDAGARAAAADLLLMTEAHCVPLPGVAAAVLTLLMDASYAAATLRTGHLEATALARRQSELERTWYALLPAGHWRSFSLRGLALRRAVYEELGGFRAAHERFAETAFGAALHLRGARIGCVEEPLLLHGNAPTARDLEAALASCARGQWVWRDELDRVAPGLADRLLGPLPLRRRVRALSRAGRLGALALRVERSAARLRLVLMRWLCLGLVRAGRAGRWAYRQHWRAAFHHGFVAAIDAAAPAAILPARAPAFRAADVRAPGSCAPEGR